MNAKRIAIGGDHAGYDHKEKLKKILKEKGYEVTDFGPDSADSSDYPDFVHPLADSVEKGENQVGVLICGSGLGVSITANKHQKIRAALCWNDELAKLARQHNDANVICLGARFTAVEYAAEMIDTFLTTDFEGGRHARRVNKISC